MPMKKPRNKLTVFYTVQANLPAQDEPSLFIFAAATCACARPVQRKTIGTMWGRCLLVNTVAHSIQFVRSPV